MSMQHLRVSTQPLTYNNDNCIPLVDFRTAISFPMLPSHNLHNAQQLWTQRSATEIIVYPMRNDQQASLFNGRIIPNVNVLSCHREQEQALHESMLCKVTLCSVQGNKTLLSFYLELIVWLSFEYTILNSLRIEVCLLDMKVWPLLK